MISTTETRWRNNGARTIILRLKSMGMLVNQKPKIQVGKPLSLSQRNNIYEKLWNYTIVEKCLKDSYFLEAIMLEKEIKPIYGTENIKGKEYVTLDFEII